MIPALRASPENGKQVYSETNTILFIAAFFIIARDWTQSQCPSTGEPIAGFRCIHTREYYSVINRSGLLIHASA